MTEAEPLAVLRELFEPPRLSLQELREALALSEDPNIRHEVRSRLWTALEERIEADAALNERRSDALTIDQQFQVHLAWRLVRLHMHLAGVAHRYDPLETRGPKTLDDWARPRALPSSINRAEKLVTASEGLVILQHYADLSAERIGFTPPGEHDTDGPDLVTWQTFYASLALALRMSANPPPAFAFARSSAFKHLLEQPRVAWPKPHELILHELSVIKFFRSNAQQRNLEQASEIVREYYGLTDAETKAAVKLYAADTLERSQVDMDEARAIALERWEAQLANANAAFKLREAQTALVRIDNIHGLGRALPEDAAMDFTHIVFAEAARVPQRPKADAELENKQPTESRMLDVA